jgi:hypothetical protein
MTIRNASKYLAPPTKRNEKAHFGTNDLRQTSGWFMKYESYGPNNKK